MQSVEELQAQYGPGSAVEAAGRWIGLVLGEGDLRSAWPLTDEPLRRQLVEGWVTANRNHPALQDHDRSALVDGLSREQPSHYLWLGFAATQLDQMRETWSNVEPDKWGWASKPRPLSPGYERVLLVKAEGEAFVLEKDQIMQALSLVMHHVPEHGWLVAELGSSAFEG